MADLATLQQQYDNEEKTINAMPPGPAKTRMQLDFEAKYPKGRPKKVESTDNEGAVAALAYGITESLIAAFPELRPIYEKFLAKDYAGARLDYFATNYYKNLTDSAKTRQGLKATARGQYDQQLEAYRLNQRKRLTGKGINLDDESFNVFTETAFDSGLDENQLDIRILNSGKFGPIGGTTLGLVNTLKAYADDYGVNSLLNQSFWDQKSMDLFAGRITEDDLEQEIRTLSASAYAAYAPGIMAGRTLASQTSAIKQTYANLYGLDPDTVSYSAPNFMKLLQYVDPRTKQPAPIPLWEAEKIIKSQDNWLYSKPAQDQFNQVGVGILKEWKLI
jgi:hypothetical protein